MSLLLLGRNFGCTMGNYVVLGRTPPLGAAEEVSRAARLASRSDRDLASGYVLSAGMF